MLLSAEPSKGFNSLERGSGLTAGTHMQTLTSVRQRRFRREVQLVVEALVGSPGFAMLPGPARVLVIDKLVSVMVLPKALVSELGLIRLANTQYDGEPQAGQTRALHVPATLFT